MSKNLMRKKIMLLAVVVMIVLGGITFVGVKTWIRYNNPLLDVTANYYEKTVDSTTVNVNDTVEVEVFVYWHGYVLPEFTRDVKIIDPLPESYFTLVTGTNVYESNGKGRSYLFKYSLKAIRGEDESIELPTPRLYLDDVEIPLNGTNPAINVVSELS